MARNCFLGVLISSVFVFSPAYIRAQTALENTQTTTAAGEEQVDLKASADAATQWLKLIDEEKYGESWDLGSNIFHYTIKRDEWIKAEQKLRKPLGKLVSRQLVEQRPANNPKGLAEGKYMVLYYKTAFQNRPQASELLTMVLGQDGKWKVLTYHVS